MSAQRTGKPAAKHSATVAFPTRLAEDGMHLHPSVARSRRFHLCVFAFQNIGGKLSRVMDQQRPAQALITIPPDLDPQYTSDNVSLNRHRHRHLLRRSVPRLLSRITPTILDESGSLGSNASVPVHSHQPSTASVLPRLRHMDDEPCICDDMCNAFFNDTSSSHSDNASPRLMSSPGITSRQYGHALAALVGSELRYSILTTNAIAPPSSFRCFMLYTQSVLEKGV